MTHRCESLQQSSLYPDAFGVPAPAELGERRLRPRQPAWIVWRGLSPEGAVPESTAADSPTPKAERQLAAAHWGLMPHWAKSESDGKLRAGKLLIAHTETITTSRNFRDAWLKGQRCIVPLMAFYVDDWRNGKALQTRINRVDGRPMGAAAVWDRWVGPEGQDILSFALLTLNANGHGLMHRYRQPGNDAHMPVLLNEGAYDAWLDARVEKAKEFIRLYPAQSLTAQPVVEKPAKGAFKLPPQLR